MVEAHPTTLSAGRQSQSAGNVGFAQSRIPKHENGFGMSNVAALGQLEDARLGDPLHAAPVELGQLFEDRQFRLADAAFHPVGLAVSDFGFREGQEIAFTGETRACGIAAAKAA